MKVLSDEILTSIVNHFYTKRFCLIGHVIHKLIDKGIDCTGIPTSLNRMTVFGFFASKYPTLIKAMEGVDEYDLVNRLKVLNLIKKTPPALTKKWQSKEKNKLNHDKDVYKNYCAYKVILRDTPKSHNVCAGARVRVK